MYKNNISRLIIISLFITIVVSCDLFNQDNGPKYSSVSISLPGSRTLIDNYDNCFYVICTIWWYK